MFCNECGILLKNGFGIHIGFHEEQTVFQAETSSLDDGHANDFDDKTSSHKQGSENEHNHSGDVAYELIDGVVLFHGRHLNKGCREKQEKKRVISLEWNSLSAWHGLLGGSAGRVGMGGSAGEVGTPLPAA